MEKTQKSNLFICLASCLFFISGCSQEKEIGKKPSPLIPNPAGAILDPPPGRPSAETLDEAQKAFWDYLEQFNTLPENPSETAKAIFQTEGIAPDFHYIRTSEKSVLGNLEGLEQHKQEFLKRYKWVTPLLEKYNIKLPVSKKRFTNEMDQTVKSYNKLMSNTGVLDRSYHVETWLEAMLVVDYVFACGSSNDRENAVELLTSCFVGITWNPQFLEELGMELENPAAHDICWALLDDFPDFIYRGNMTLPVQAFNESNDLARGVDYSKWLIRAQKYVPDDPKINLQRILINNNCVQEGLLHHAIYLAHTGQPVRPDKGGAITTRILFKRIYGRKFQTAYKNYLSLLDKAYPITPEKPNN